MGAVAVSGRTGTYLAEFSDRHGPGTHWSTYAYRWPRDDSAARLWDWVELCRTVRSSSYGSTPPDDQLQLVWAARLSSFSSGHRASARLRLVDCDWIRRLAEELGRWEAPAVSVTRDELDTASAPGRLIGRRRRKPASICSQEFERSAAAEAGPSGFAGGASIPCHRAWRDGDAAAGADREGKPAHQRLFYLTTLRQRRYSKIWKSAPCSKGSGTSSDRPSRASTMHCAPLRPKTTGAPRGLPAKPVVTDRVRPGDPGASGRLQPAPTGHRWWGGTELTNDRLWRFDPV